MQNNHLISVIRAGRFPHYNPLSVYHSFIADCFLSYSAEVSLSLCYHSELHKWNQPLLQTFQKPCSKQFSIIFIPFASHHPWMILPPLYESGKDCRSWIGGNRAGEATKWQGGGEMAFITSLTLTLWVCGVCVCDSISDMQSGIDNYACVCVIVHSGGWQFFLSMCQRVDGALWTGVAIMHVEVRRGSFSHFCQVVCEISRSSLWSFETQTQVSVTRSEPMCDNFWQVQVEVRLLCDCEENEPRLYSDSLFRL